MLAYRGCLARRRRRLAGSGKAGPGARWKRGAVIVQTAVLSTLLCGSAALAIDMAATHAARPEHHRAADAAALAAAAQMADHNCGGPPALPVEAGQSLVGRSPVFRVANSLARTDVIFGGGGRCHAAGSIERCAARLDAIFTNLGGKRPVVLIE